MTPAARQGSGDRLLAWAGLAAVLAHAAVAAAHKAAHDALGVELSLWQWTYVVAVIGVAPLLAAALLWTRWIRRGALLLAWSMAASLAFGLYWHYLADSPDHVAHLPAGEAQGLFRWTAALLALSEVTGAATGVWGTRRLGADGS